MELRMQYATTADGVRIAYGTAGKGPYIVRAASLPFCHAQMEWAQGSDFFDRLAENWTIVQFDPRGTGLSDRNPADLSLEARILDLDAVVDRIGLDKFVLHAVGWSGPMAITYAVRHPQRVTHLILDDAQARTRDFMNVPQIRALDALTDDWDTFLEHLVFTSYGLGRDQAAPHIAYLRACATPETVGRTIAAVRSDDVTDLLPEISVPTLVVQHSGLSRQQVETARDLAARIPDARLVVLEGLMRDDTEQIVRAIGELLGSTLAARPEPAPHSHETGATVRTILFTDIVGHTAMMQRLGDKAGREVLRQHENLTRDVLKRFSGIEVKTMGDGFMASFASVTAAVECAIALQRAFAGHNESAPEPIVIRVGLDAGEPIEEAGDFFGSTVIMAARIAAEAGAGEILASEVVRGLCAGKGFLFADRGEYLMRGFEEPARLCEVGWRQ